MDSTHVEVFAPTLTNDEVKFFEEDSSLGKRDIVSELHEAMQDCGDYSILRNEMPDDGSIDPVVWEQWLVAVRGNDVDMMETLLQDNERILEQKEGDTELTSLHLAATAGSLAVCSTLLAIRPSLIEETDAEGNQPLHMASLHGHDSVVRLLLDVGASPTAVNYREETPIALAATPDTLLMMLESAAPSVAVTAAAAFKGEDESSEEESEEDGSYQSETADLDRFEIEVEENVEKEEKEEKHERRRRKHQRFGWSETIMCMLALAACVVFKKMVAPPLCTLENYQKGSQHFGKPCSLPKLDSCSDYALVKMLQQGDIGLLSDSPHFVYLDSRYGHKTILRCHEDNDVEMIAAVRKTISENANREMIMKQAKEMEEMKKEQEELKRLREKKAKEIEAQRKMEEREKERTKKVQQEAQEKKDNEEKAKNQKRTGYSFLWEPVLFIIWLFCPHALSMMFYSRFPKSQVPIRFVLLTRAEQGYGIYLKGAFVKEIAPGSPAAIDGNLQVGDEIVGVEGENAETLSPKTIHKMIRASQKSVRLWVRENKGRA